MGVGLSVGGVWVRMHECGCGCMGVGADAGARVR